LRDHRHRSGRKTLVQRAKSGDPDVRLQATWGISVEVETLTEKLRSARKSLEVEKAAQKAWEDEAEHSAALKAHLTEEKSQSAELQQRLDDRVITLKAAQDALAQTESALKQRQHETEQAAAEIRRLTAQTEALSTEIDVARAKPSIAQVEEIAGLEQTVQTLRSEIQDYAEEKSASLNQLQARHRELAQLAQLVTSLEERNTEANRFNAGVIARERSALESKLKIAEVVQEERDLYQRMVNELKASTSWRITGPLRSIVRLIRFKKT